MKPRMRMPLRIGTTRRVAQGVGQVCVDAEIQLRGDDVRMAVVMPGITVLPRASIRCAPADGVGFGPTDSMTRAHQHAGLAEGQGFDVEDVAVLNKNRGHGDLLPEGLSTGMSWIIPYCGRYSVKRKSLH